MYTIWTFFGHFRCYDWTGVYLIGAITHLNQGFHRPDGITIKEEFEVKRSLKQSSCPTAFKTML